MTVVSRNGMRRCARLAAGLVLWAFASAAGAGEDPCNIVKASRVVAVGDVHGAYENFVTVLRMAGLLDAEERWSGGSARLVQTGDVLDRGADSRKALDLLMRLEREADKAGGRVHALLGNHEIMRMRGDRRYVSAGEYEAFSGPDSEKQRERYLEAVVDAARSRSKSSGEAFDEAAFEQRFRAENPPGVVEMREAFGPSGRYGRWLRDRDAVVRIDGVAFLHGGISAAVAPLGCKAINESVRRELDEPAADPAKALSARSDGPLWYRGLAQEDEAAFASTVDGILTAFGARALVVGHTPTRTGRIQARFGERVVMIDAGMLPAYGGHLAALEIGPDGMTAIYPNERVRLAPAKAASAE